MEYPKGSRILCSLLQRWVAKLDENGTKAETGVKDLVLRVNRMGQQFKKAFKDYLSIDFVDAQRKEVIRARVIIARRIFCG